MLYCFKDFRGKCHSFTTTYLKKCVGLRRRSLLNIVVVFKMCCRDSRVITFKYQPMNSPLRFYIINKSSRLCVCVQSVSVWLCLRGKMTVLFRVVKKKINVCRSCTASISSPIKTTAPTLSTTIFQKN